jgi:uncharacterized membrane protein (DUF485 family)
MSDSYSEVTHQSWGSRLKESSRGALIGIIFFFGAFYLLFWNEGRAVHRAQTLEEGASIVLSIDSDIVEWVYDGKLVHLSGDTNTDETLKDVMFGVTAAEIIKLRRVVEMYQWDESVHSETEEMLGGGTQTVTTYSYSKKWSSTLIDSSQFMQPEGHQNPSYMPVSGDTVRAKQVKVGEFSLSPSLVEKLNNFQHLPITQEMFEQLQKKRSSQFKSLHLHYGNYYVGYDPAYPQIGDFQIKFEVVRPTTISVVAKQVSSRLTPYMTEAGGEIELFEYGVLTAGEMFKRAQRANTILTWILRLVGFVMMFIGLSTIFYVLKILAAVIPVLGNLVGIIGGFIILVLTFILSLITIAIAWIYYRPLLGIALLLIAAGLLYLLKFSRKSPPGLMPETEVPSKQ